MQPNDGAIRKRAQIANTNRTMFLWVAAGSAVVGMAVVVSIFLIQRLAYNEEVLNRKYETVSILDSNLKAVDGLKQEIRKLDVNSALLSARASDNDQAIRVILDALPSEANSLALGASLEKKLLSGITDLKLETIQVTPVAGVEVVSSGVAASQTDDGYYSIDFTISVSGTQGALRQALVNLERSVRTIEVASLRIEGQPGDKQDMVIQGRAFYQPTKVLEFSEEAI